MYKFPQSSLKSHPLKVTTEHVSLQFSLVLTWAIFLLVLFVSTTGRFKATLSLIIQLLHYNTNKSKGYFKLCDVV